MPKKKPVPPERGNAAPAKTIRKPIQPYVIHTGCAIAGLLMLSMYFGSHIVAGVGPKAPDTSAHVGLAGQSRQWREAHDGKMPLWTPTVFSGMPSYGSIIYTETGALNRMIAYPVRGNYGLRLLVVFAIAGLCIYVLMIRYGRSPLAAFLAASVYVFTPYFMGLINAGHNNKIWAAGVVPILLLAADYLLDKRSLKAFCLFALSASWMMVVRHPQVAYYGFMLIGCIILADGLLREDTWSARLKRLGMDIVLTGAGIAVAIGASLLPYGPSLEYTPESVRGSHPSAVKSPVTATGKPAEDPKWRYATMWSMHPKELITFVVPSYYGLWNDPRYDQARDLRAHTYWGHMPFTQSTHYLGLIPLLLVFLVKPGRKGVIWGCIGFSVAAILIGLGKWFPVLYWPAYTFFPYFSKFRIPSMIYMVLPLSIGIVGAWALDQIMSEPTGVKPGVITDSMRSYERAAIIIAGVMVFMMVIILAGSQDAMAFLLQREMAYPVGVREALSKLRVDMMLKDLAIALVMTCVLVAGVWLVTRRKLAPVIVGAVLVAVSIADLLRIDMIFMDAVPATFTEKPFQKPASVDALKADAETYGETNYRIAPLVTGRGGSFQISGTNDYGNWGLRSVSGYHAVKLRIYDDLMVSGGLMRRHVLNMLNTRYFIGPPGIGDSTLVPLNTGTEVAYRNTKAFPRAWWVPSLRHAKDATDALYATIDNRFDPAKTAVVQNAPDLKITGAPDVLPLVKEWDFERVVIETNADRPGYLVVSEVFYKAWKATIDDTPAPIYQTNYVLRGMMVPAGKHTITMIYDRSTYNTSAVISRILFWLLVLVLIEELVRTNLLPRVRKRENPLVEREQ
jgi:hypothetical protein